MGEVERTEGAPGEGGGAEASGKVALPPSPGRWRDSASLARGEARGCARLAMRDGLRRLAGALGRCFGGGAGGGALLRLLAGLRFLRVVAGLSLHEAGGVEEAQHAVGRLRALGKPGLHLLGLDGDAGRIILLLHRIVRADLLDEAPVARRAAVGDDDAVIWTLLGARAGETDF